MKAAPEASRKEIGETRIGVRMIPEEFLAIFLNVAAVQERSTSRVVKLKVMQNNQSGVPDEIRPREIMARGIAQLINDQVVGRLPMTPKKIVRAADPNATAMSELSVPKR
ncbi:MAG: hypothetical protein ACRD1T_14035, partial [Acidimicrobiia bacterium]